MYYRRFRFAPECNPGFIVTLVGEEYPTRELDQVADGDL